MRRNYPESKGEALEFPGGSVVKTLCFHHKGVQVRSLVRGTKIPHARLSSLKKKSDVIRINSYLRKALEDIIEPTIYNI